LARRPLPDPLETRDIIIRLDELRTENERLRRLVGNLFLEKVRLEEALQSRGTVGADAWP
jgi:hypothetical protein